MRIGNRAGRQHAADTPVVIGRVAILQIILGSNRPPHHKSLVAHQHTHTETLHRQHLGGLQPTHGHETTPGIDESRLAIDDVGVGFFDGTGYFLQRIGSMQGIARIQEDKIATLGTTQTLVHGIVESPVGFARHRGDGPRSTGQGYRTVGRGTVDHQIFIIGKGLALDTLQRGRQCSLRMEGNRDNREKRTLHHNLFFMNNSISAKLSACWRSWSKGRSHQREASR